MARITVHVTPRGGRDAIDAWDGDILRVRVSAAPADGKANASVVRLIAKAAGVSPSSARIVAGGSSRTKVVELDGIVDAEELRRLMDAGADRDKQ